jgi:outer membrane protein TolC
VIVAALGLLAAAAAEPPALETVSFDEAVRRAVVRSTASLVASEEVRRAEGLLEEARSGAAPTLFATGTKTRLDADRVLSSGVVAAAKDQTSGNLALTVPLVAPARWYQWAHGSQGLDAAVAGEQDVRRSAAIAAGRAYLTIIAQRRVVDVTARARDTAKAHYDFAHTRRAAGVGNALDELRAEQEVAADEVQLEQALTALARVREALGLLAGEDRPLDAGDEPALAGPPSVEQAGADAIASRADVRAAQSRTRAARALADDSWSDWLPTLLGTWQGGYQDPPTLTTPRWGWQAQLILQVPIFEGGLRVGQARERGALASEAEAALDAQLKQARSEVRLAFETLQRAAAAYAAARRGADRARDALELATQAYKAGAVNNLEVIDAERGQRDAATSAIDAEDGARQARLDLLAATGRFP